MQKFHPPQKHFFRFPHLLKFIGYCIRLTAIPLCVLGCILGTCLPYSWSDPDPHEQKTLSFSEIYCPSLGPNDFSVTGLPSMSYTSFDAEKSSCTYTADGNKPHFIITYYPTFTLHQSENIDMNSVCTIAVCTSHTTVINNHTTEIVEQATSFNNNMFATEIYVAKETTQAGVIGFNYIYEEEVSRSYEAQLIHLLTRLIP